MNLSNLSSNIHWIPVVIMTIVSFALGAVWHQKFLFGKTWAAENKQNLDRKMNIPLIFGGTALVHFLALAGLSAVVSDRGLNDGILIGFLISVIWILPAMTSTYLFANRSLKLLAIDAGMFIILFSLAGGIMGIW